MNIFITDENALFFSKVQSPKNHFLIKVDIFKVLLYKSIYLLLFSLKNILLNVKKYDFGLWTLEKKTLILKSFLKVEIINF